MKVYKLAFALLAAGVAAVEGLARPAPSRAVAQHQPPASTMVLAPARAVAQCRLAAPVMVLAEPHKPLLLRIDGRWYDATDWAGRHPGGSYCLKWVAGFDVSGIFHTIHLFGRAGANTALSQLAEVAEADLSTRPGHEPLVFPDIRRVPKAMQPPIFEDWVLGRAVGAGGVALGPPEPFVKQAVGDRRGWSAMEAARDTPFKLELEALLHRHFDSPAQYKATAEHWLRLVGALALTASCVGGWAHGDVLATLALPWAQWLLFSPAVHEASHHTLSTDPRVNWAAMFLGTPFIFNPLIWYPQHIVSHHQYPNDEALDVDLHHLRPARMHPATERDDGASGVHFLFKGFFTTAGMSVLWPLRHLVSRPTARFYTLNTPAPAAVPKLHVALSLLPALLANAYPWWLVWDGQANVALGLFLWLFPWLGTGAIWTVMTQVSHAQEDAQAAPAYDDYFRYQVESAIDYSVESSLVPMLTASLSLQSIHHALPTVCGCHFASLYPEYEAICERHGVRLNTRTDLAHAWRTNVDRVFELSSQLGEPDVWRRLGGNLWLYLAAPYLLFATPVLIASALLDRAAQVS